MTDVDWSDTNTYICARCYRERPLTDTPLKAQGEDTNMTYRYCGDCQKSMAPQCTCNQSMTQPHAKGCLLFGTTP